jgi:hypothetical protein
MESRLQCLIRHSTFPVVIGALGRSAGEYLTSHSRSDHLGAAGHGVVATRASYLAVMARTCPSLQQVP